MRTVIEIEAEIRKLADKEGYLLNPDREILEGIIEGISANEDKLGYWNCPCRRASGDRAQDLDIICPCRYREPDLKEFGRCYCALYVTQGYINQGLPPDPIPERRKPGKTKKTSSDDVDNKTEIPNVQKNEKIKTWRCQVCGYLCARPEAPPVCPICRAKKERFEEYKI
jgi:ferredoxin-thioredoxin reductase catalytic subunit